MFFFIHFPEIIGLFFDDSGNLQNVRQMAISRETLKIIDQIGIGNTFSEYPEQEIARLMQKTEFVPAQISIKKFFLPDKCFGIKDYPDHCQDVRLHPQAFSNEEKEHVNEQIQRWNKEGQFVLWLNEQNNLWIDKTGLVVAS